MLSEALLKAQEAIEERLREEGVPMRAGDLLKSIKEGKDMRDIDLREAVWLLIGKGKIHLNWDRQLVLADEVESQVTVG